MIDQPLVPRVAVTRAACERCLILPRLAVSAHCCVCRSRGVRRTPAESEPEVGGVFDSQARFHQQLLPVPAHEQPDIQRQLLSSSGEWYRALLYPRLEWQAVVEGLLG